MWVLPVCIIVLFIVHYYVKLYVQIKGIKKIKFKLPLPFLGNVIDFRNKFVILDCMKNYARQYGRVMITFKMCTPYIMVADNELMAEIMNSKKFNQKDFIYDFLHGWLGHGLLTSYGRKWTSHRKLITPSFHFKVLKNFVTTFESIADVLINKLNRVEENQSFDVFPYITLYSLDIICETALGTKVHAQTNSDNEYVSAVRELLNVVVRRTTNPFKINQWSYIFTRDYWKNVRLTKMVHSHTYEMIERRKKLREEGVIKIGEEDEFGSKVKVAFIDMLIHGTADGIPLTDEEIREEVDTFMFEGHDTTSSAITFALYCLALNPEVQENAYREITGIFGEDRNRHATYEEIQEMHYLEMVIKETLRLFPSVPLFTRTITEDVHCKVGKIRAGTSIVLAVHPMHRLPEYFPEPETFKPERFSPENAANIKPFSYVPFSGGFRNCIGQKFAMLDMKSALSRIIRNFKILPDPSFEPIFALEVILKSDNGIKIMLQKRL